MGVNGGRASGAGNNVRENCEGIWGQSSEQGLIGAGEREEACPASSLAAFHDPSLSHSHLSSESGGGARKLSRRRSRRRDRKCV